MKMNKIQARISVIAFVCLFISCQKEPLPEGSILKAVISPRVSATTVVTKGIEDSGKGTCIASYTMDGISDRPLYVTVYEYDNDGLPSGMSVIEAKGSVTTTTGINSAGQQFLMDAWLESSNRYDGSQDIDGHEYETADKTDWHFIKNAVVGRGNSEWSFAGGEEYFWRNQVKTNFWSVYPTSAAGRTITYPSGTAADADQVELSMTYTLPAPCSTSPYTDAQNQQDLCFAFNTKTWQSGSDNKIDIEFYHALAAVYFKIGDVEDVTIERIGFNNVCSSAVCDITGGSGNVPVFEWMNHSAPVSIHQDFVTSDFDATSKEQSFTGSDKIFMLIPQTLGTGTEMSVTFRNGAGPEETKTADISIHKDGTSVEWKPGKKYLYKISCNPYSYDFELVTSSQAAQSFSNTTSDSEEAVIPVASERSSAAGTIAWDWTIKSYQIGSGTPVEVNGTSFTDGGGLTVSKDGDNLKIMALARSLADPGDHDFWINKNGISGDADGSGWSPMDWSESRATTSAPLDLSKFDFKTEEAQAMATANCYVIRHAGTYKLPLVYGNGVAGGGENRDSFEPEMAPGGDAGHFLAHFQNHLDHDITSAYIENNSGCVANSATVVWQDRASIVTNLEIIGNPDLVGSYTSDNVRYLQFTIPQGSICQNNAVIAVMDKDGHIIWSWHIWITNNPALLSDPVSVMNNTGVEHKFFPFSNLGAKDPEGYPFRPSVKIVLLQKKSGKEIEIVVEQPPVFLEPSDGVYYQFGRKDPMPAEDIIGFSYNYDGGTTMGGSILNPGIFFCPVGYGDASSDWLNDGSPKAPYYNLWTGKKCVKGMADQDDDMIKTIYDPSPVGYKIPDSNAFTGFTTTGDAVSSRDGINSAGEFNYGWHFYVSPDKQGGTIFFPTAGYRNFYDGLVDGNATDANYWTAVPANNPYFCYNLDFRSNDADPTGGYYRSYGFAVRPVLEE